MEGQMSILDFLPDPTKKAEPQTAPTMKYERLTTDAKMELICQHSGHSCNKKNLWEVADTFDDLTCPHICCRLCSVSCCGARCNGSSEPAKAKPVDLRGICDDPYCPECGEALDESKHLDCDKCPHCGAMISWVSWHRMNDHYRKEYRVNCPYFIGAVPFQGEHDDPDTNMCNIKDDGTLADDCFEWTKCDPYRCPKHKMEVGIL